MQISGDSRLGWNWGGSSIQGSNSGGGGRLYKEVIRWDGMRGIPGLMSYTWPASGVKWNKGIFLKPELKICVIAGMAG